MSKYNLQSTSIRSWQPNSYYWVAMSLSLVEAVCLLFGDRVESQLGLAVPFRLLMFTALVRCAESRDQFSNRATWLALPYMVASVLHYSMNNGEVPVFSQLYYLSAFISLPLFDVMLAQVRSSDSLAGVFELVSFVALGVVSIIHVFFSEALVVFWESFLRSYLQAVFRLTQLTLSSSDVAAAVHAAGGALAAAARLPARAARARDRRDGAVEGTLHGVGLPTALLGLCHARRLASAAHAPRHAARHLARCRARLAGRLPARQPAAAAVGRRAQPHAPLVRLELALHGRAARPAQHCRAGHAAAPPAERHAGREHRRLPSNLPTKSKGCQNAISGGDSLNSLLSVS